MGGFTFQVDQGGLDAKPCQFSVETATLDASRSCTASFQQRGQVHTTECWHLHLPGCVQMQAAIECGVCGVFYNLSSISIEGKIQGSRHPPPPPSPNPPHPTHPPNPALPTQPQPSPNPPPNPALPTQPQPTPTQPIPPKFHGTSGFFQGSPPLPSPNSVLRPLSEDNSHPTCSCRVAPRLCSSSWKLVSRCPLTSKPPEARGPRRVCRSGYASIATCPSRWLECHECVFISQAEWTGKKTSPCFLVCWPLQRSKPC